MVYCTIHSLLNCAVLWCTLLYKLSTLYCTMVYITIHFVMYIIVQDNIVSWKCTALHRDMVMLTRRQFFLSYGIFTRVFCKNYDEKIFGPTETGQSFVSLGDGR